jgi:TusA-related sulfurtransferase
MKTLNNIKTNTMKNKIVVIVMAIMLMPALSMAQDIFEKYNDNSDVTYVSIKPKMFQMIAKMGINVDDPEAKSFMDMVNSITSFKTLVTDNKSISADITKWVKSRSSSLEELMEVKDDGSEVKFYVKEGKDSDHVKELLIYVNGIDKAMKGQGVEINGENRKIETVVVSLTGDINLNEISKLTDKMNIPGGEHLDKKK